MFPVIRYVGNAEIPVDYTAAVNICEDIKELAADPQDLIIGKLRLFPEQQIL